MSAEKFTYKDMSVEVIAASKGPHGQTVCTIQACYPLFIHAEVMTHRIFSRNARSARAVPTKTLIREKAIEPISYGQNRPGMTAGDELPPIRRAIARATWHSMAAVNRLGVRILNGVGLHKQWANRPLGWFSNIHVLITSTQWNNWDALRIDDNAQPEITILAKLMKEAREAAEYKPLFYGEWHLPYIREEDYRDARAFMKANPGRAKRVEDILLAVSTARCARVTYQPFDGRGDIEAELARFERLVLVQPVHASPAEHQCTPDILFDEEVETPRMSPWANPHLHGNLKGFIQHRQLISSNFIPG